MNQLIMKNKHLFFSLLITILIFSCNKDDDAGTTQPEQQALKLTKVNNGLDITEISYSNQNKPETITYENTFKNLILNNDGKLIEFGDNTYSYDASGKLETMTNTNGSTCNFTYNSQGLIVRQNIITNQQVSSANTDLTIQRIYLYDNLDRIISCTETSNQPGSSIKKFNLTYNSDGELVKVVDVYSNDNGTTYIVNQTVELAYDSQKNPEKLFYDSLQPNSTSFITTFVFGISSQSDPIRLTLGFFFPLYYLPTHNVLNSKITFTNTFGENIINETYSYQYDGDYPITGERALIRTLDGQMQSNFTFQLFWEYITD